MEMKFFVIGLGSIGLRHAKNLLALGHEVWGYDMNPQVAIEAAVVAEGIQISPEPDCDAYVICTPPSEHLHEMWNAVRLSRHVFVEKPISLPVDIGPLPGFLEEAKRRNLVVMVGNMLRFHPNVILAKQHIEHPISATFRVKQKNTKYTEDVILNWGAHEIDLALYLFGPGKCKHALGNKQEATVIISHDSGVTSTIVMDYLTEPEIRCLKVETLDALEHNIDLTRHDWNEVYACEMEWFAALINGARDVDGRAATGEDGLATLKIINDAQRMAGI